MRRAPRRRPHQPRPLERQPLADNNEAMIPASRLCALWIIKTAGELNFMRMPFALLVKVLMSKIERDYVIYS
jgi:hypothetical protein